MVDICFVKNQQTLLHEERKLLSCSDIFSALPEGGYRLFLKQSRAWLPIVYHDSLKSSAAEIIGGVCMLQNYYREDYIYEDYY
jgi:hypothetical protein